MEAKDFIEKWGIKRSELALLLDVPLSTMAHWFSPNENRTTPPKVKRSLLYLDYLFSSWHQSAQQFPDARAVFDSCCDRADGKAFKN